MYMWFLSPFSLSLCVFVCVCVCLCVSSVCSCVHVHNMENCVSGRSLERSEFTSVKSIGGRKLKKLFLPNDIICSQLINTGV